jgi:poly-gamma-glutamate synthesis protein (capsule biosynthesis protein)
MLPVFLLFVLMLGMAGYVLVVREVRSAAASLPVTVELLAEPALMPNAQRIAQAASGQLAGRFTVTVAPVPAKGARKAVSEGIQRVALVVAGDAQSGGTQGNGGRVIARLPAVIGVPAIGSRPPLSQAQARALIQGNKPSPDIDLGNGPGKYTLLPRDEFVARAVAGQLSPALLAVVGLDDLGVQVAALAVDGVLPGPATVRDGTYPLTFGVEVVWAATTLGPIRRMWSMLTRPEFRHVAEFAGWLESARAKPALLGVGELVKLTAVGDVMLDRGVARWIESMGPDYPFDAVRDILTAADIAVCNLESPFGTGGRRLAEKGIWFQARPETATSLARAGFDIVSLANNHSMDHGVQGLLECFEHLQAVGVKYFGAGHDLAQARSPVILTAGGLRIAFLGYSEFADLYWSNTEKFAFEARADRPGVAPLRQSYRTPSAAVIAAQNKHIAEDIAAARSQSDIVVVSLHWGVEYENVASEYQKLVAQFMLDHGATLILGHHPHAIQGLLPSGDGLVAFSLGNFVFDQPWPITQESMILEVQLSERGIFRWDVIPVQITSCQPRPVLGLPEGAGLWYKILDLSWELY